MVTLTDDGVSIVVVLYSVFSSDVVPWGSLVNLWCPYVRTDVALL